METMSGKIVVGIDGSERSDLALRWALALAAPSQAPVEAVLVWQYPVALAWPAGWTYGSTIDFAEADAETQLGAAIERVVGAQRPTWLLPIARQGDPAQILIEASTGAGLLVVGNRGRGGFTGLLLGSVSAACAKHAHCPVLGVHDDQPPPVG